MPGLLTNMIRPAVEGFTDGNNGTAKKDSYVEFTAVLIAFVLALVILSLIGKLLWNSVVVELFTVVRPAKSFLQILGLFVFISLLL